MMHAYWLLATQKDKKIAARAIKGVKGFIGFYPNSLEPSYQLVAIFDTKQAAQLAESKVQLLVKIENPDFSKVEDCKFL